MMKKILFVGGPWDGLVREIEEAAEEWNVQAPVKPLARALEISDAVPADFAVKYFRYHRVRIFGDRWRSWEVFTTETDIGALIQKLIDGYAGA